MTAECRIEDADQALKRSAMTVAVLSSFVTPFMASSINVALPSIENEFELDAVLLSWVATSYLLASAAFLVPFGRIADIRGRKKVFLYGSFVMAVASALCAVAPDKWTLLCFRVFQGIGGGMIFGTSVAILSCVYPPKERGRALGTAVASVYIGLSAGPFLGGILTENFGWRSLFVLVVPLNIAVILVTVSKLKPEWAEAAGEKFDKIGSLMYAASLTTLMIGVSLLPGPLGFAILAIGGLGLLGFVLLELKVTSPVLDMALYMRNRVFAFSNLAALINYSATFAVTFMMSLYLYYVKSLDYEAVGIVLVAQPIVMAVFSPIAGKLSDMIEPRLIASSGMGISTAGLALLSLFSKETDTYVIVAVLAFLGFGFALFSSPNTNAIMGSVQKRQYGVASASVGTMRLIGQVLSMGIAMIFLALFVGELERTPEVADRLMDSYHMSFYVFSILCFFGIFASLARGKGSGAAKS